MHTFFRLLPSWLRPRVGFDPSAVVASADRRSQAAGGGFAVVDDLDSGSDGLGRRHAARTLPLALLGVFALSVCGGWLQAASLHVSLAGNDGGSGSEQSPFRTVQKALNVAQAGDVIVLGAGNFGEDVSTVRDGTEAKKILVDGQGRATVRQINFKHAHVTFSRVTVTGKTQAYQASVWFWVGADFCILENCTIDNGLVMDVIGIGWKLGPNRPFDDTTASHCRIVGNTVKNVLGTSMISIAGDDNLIESNQFYDGAMVDFVRLWGRNNVIRKNQFTNNYAVESVGNHPDFIQTFGNNGHGSQGHTIDGNLIKDIESGQLSQLEGNMVPEIGNWVFKNNLFINIALQASCTIPDIQYYNNVFYRCNWKNGSHPLIFGSRAYEANRVFSGVAGTNYAHGVKVKNNVFLACGDERTTRGWYGFGTELRNIAANYNYVAKAGFIPVSQDAEKRIIGGSVAWDGMKWYEPNGINGGDPKFANLELLHFELLSGSPLIDKGERLSGVVQDFRGAPRPQGAALEIGAFEFGNVSGVVRPTVPTGLRVIESN